MRFRSILAVAATLAVTAQIALPRPAGAAAVLPATRSATYALPFPDARSKAPQAPGEADRSVTPPGLAFQSDDGSLLASTNVNRITCRASVDGDGTDEARIEWLGTQMGVKAIDRSGHRVTLYTRRDGLPGDYVEAIAADASRVYCLVRLGSPEKLALCATYIKESGHWVTLATIDANVPHPDLEAMQRRDSPDFTTYARWGQSHLAILRDGGVVVAPSVVDAHADVVMYRWDRANQRLVPIAPDTVLRADTHVLAIRDLCVADDGQSVYLATTAGLQSIDIFAAHAVWKRTLPNRIVDALLIAPAPPGSGNTKILYAACRARQRGDSDSVGRYLQREAMQLVAVSVPDGAETILPLGLNSAAGNDRDPTAVIATDTISRAADGAIWLTEHGRYDYNGRGHYDRGGFDRYDPQTKRHLAFDLDGNSLLAYSRRPSPSVPLPRMDFDLKAITYWASDSDRIKTDAAAIAIPESAVRVLAFSLKIGDATLRADSDDARRDEDAGLYPLIWQRRFFPRWISPAPKIVQNERERGNNGAFDDTLAPDHCWFTDDQTLVYASRNVVGRSNAEKTKNIRYILRSGIREIPPRVISIAASIPGSNQIALECSSGIYVVDEDVAAGKRVWKRIQNVWDGGGNIYEADMAQLVRVGPARQLAVAVSGNDVLRVLAPSTGRFVKTSIPLPGDDKLLGASASGLHFEQYDAESFVPIRMDRQGHLVALPGVNLDVSLPANLIPPDGDRQRETIGISGDIVWYTAYLRRRPSDPYYDADKTLSVIGYDAAKRRWTAVLVLNPRRGYQFRAFAASNGGTYVAEDQDSASVFGYDPATNAWKPVAAPLSPHHGDDRYSNPTNYMVIAADAREIYLSDGKRLLSFNRKTNAWQSTPLPDFAHAEGEAFWNKATATTTALWIGTERGLWRFDRVRHIFQEIYYPISLDPLPPVVQQQGLVEMQPWGFSGRDNRKTFVTRQEWRQTDIPPPASMHSLRPSGAELEISAVDDHSVWGLVHPWGGDIPILYRFDRNSHRFILIPRTNAVPVSPDLQSDGDSAWSLDAGGAYHLNPVTGRFALRFAFSSSYGREDAVSRPPGVLPWHVGGVVADPVQRDIAYIMIDDCADAFANGGKQPPILYRFHKSTGILEPLPIDPAFVAAANSSMRLPTESAYYVNDRRPPFIHGTGGFYVNASHIWIGTTIGVFCVDRKTSVWTPAKLPYGAPTEMDALDIHADPTGAIWISDHDNVVRIAK